MATAASRGPPSAGTRPDVPDVPSEWIWQICCPCRWWCRAQNGLPETHWQPCRLGSFTHYYCEIYYIYIIFKVMFEMQEHIQLLSAQEKITARATPCDFPPASLWIAAFFLAWTARDVLQGRLAGGGWTFAQRLPFATLMVCGVHGARSLCGCDGWRTLKAGNTWFSSCDRHWWAECVDVQVYTCIYIYMCI